MSKYDTAISSAGRDRYCIRVDIGDGQVFEATHSGTRDSAEKQAQKLARAFRNGNESTGGRAAGASYRSPDAEELDKKFGIGAHAPDAPRVSSYDPVTGVQSFGVPVRR